MVDRLSRGEKIHIIEQKGSWTKILLKTFGSGWISNTTFEEQKEDSLPKNKPLIVIN